MKYYILETGQVYAYETYEDFELYGKPGLVEMTQNQIDMLLAPKPVELHAPQKVTMRQARLALHSAGFLEGVEAAINALPEPPRTAARIEWEFSSEVHRHKEFVLMLADALGLTSEQIDTLFIEAETL